MILCDAHYIKTPHYYIENRNDIVCKTLNFISLFGSKYVNTHLATKVFKYNTYSCQATAASRHDKRS